MPTLRPVTTDDYDDVLALNEVNVEALAPMDRDRLVQLASRADRFEVVDVAGAFAGFVVTFAAGTAYDSENYTWFTEHYADRFYYLDRIVLSDRFRRQGLGGFVYDELEEVAAKYDRLALEVNLLPRNDVSLAFHEHRGFREVGRLGDETHLVSLMAKELS
ncbi:MAG TPA: GNAT family N-acetyltransferase [Nocardioidaceae bacterium]|nr:GNAT family N-acetyltransferase [Nocardioidaceae bacterium]